MRDVRTLMPNDAMVSSVERLVERLGAVTIVSAAGWGPLADRLPFTARSFNQSGSGQQTAANSTVVLIGPPAFVLKHAAEAEDNFGFVMPVVQTGRRWSRAVSWRDDATLELWRLGWSPRALDRLLLPTRQAMIEFAIGDVRRTPVVASD